MTDRATPSPPAPITAEHRLELFRSGEPSLDEWLQRRARANLLTGASRTYVTCAAGALDVIGYYALSMGHLLNTHVPGAMRRNMPQHVPAVILGRLAVDTSWQGHGLGAALLADAVARSLRASQEVAARAIVVQAISPAAEAFYLHHGFVRLPTETAMLALDLSRHVGSLRRT